MARHVVSGGAALSAYLSEQGGVQTDSAGSSSRQQLTMSTPMEPAWELSKENVAPLARGRDKESMRIALHASDAEIADAKSAHEGALRAALDGNGPHAQDPLAAAASFAKWAVDAYPPRSPQLSKVLEAACRLFVDEPRYANDARYVRLWVRYADSRPDALEVFNYMRAHGIGSKTTLFYEAWATTLEYKKDFPNADEAYTLGLRAGAEPTARLEQRRREFLSRMVARDRRAEAKAAARREEPSRPSKPRGERAAPRGRTGHGLAHTDRDAAHVRDENERPALGTLSTHEVESNRRPFERAPKPRSGLSSRGAADQSQRGANDTNKRFQVFADASSRDKTGHASAEDPEPVPAFPSLSRFDEVVKENEGTLPEKWAGTTLPQDSLMIRARQRRRGARGGAPDFQIFQDGTESPGANRAPGETAPPATVESPTTRKKSSGSANPSSPTINTKIAMQQVEEMFNSPLPFERQQDRFQQSRERATPHEHGSSAPHETRDTRIKNHEYNEMSGDSLSQKEGSKAADSMRSNAEPTSATDPQAEGSSFTIYEDAPKQPDAGSPKQAGSSNAESCLTNMCFESIPDLPGFHLMENSIRDVSEGSYVSLQAAEGQARSFIVESMLGVGSLEQSKVFSATPVDENGSPLGDFDDDDDDDDESSVALKVASNINLAWEFYVLKAFHSRYTGSTSSSIPQALFFFHGAPWSFLGIDRVGVASLHQVIEHAPSGKLPDLVAAFFLVEILKSVEALHSVGIIHADVTLRNVLLRKESGGAWTGSYNGAGRNGWAGKGISLVDMNHAIDTKHKLVSATTVDAIHEHTAVFGCGHLEKEYRLQGGDSQPGKWGFDVDCYAAAMCGLRLLGVASIDELSRSPDVIGRRAWLTALEPLMRVGPDLTSDISVHVVHTARTNLERLLVDEDAGASSLRPQLKKVFVAATEARHAGDTTRG